MITVRRFVGALLAAIAAAVLYTLATVVVGLFFPLWWARLSGEGAGGAGVVISETPVLVVALLAFVAVFYWHPHRRRPPA